MSSKGFSVKVEVTPVDNCGGCGGGAKNVEEKQRFGLMSIVQEDPCRYSTNQQRTPFYGMAVNLAGFGYPVEAYYLIYSSALTSVPVTPQASSDLGNPKTAITVDPNNGSWEALPIDTCGNTPRYRKIVTYFKYVNSAGDVNYQIDSQLYTIYPCSENLSAC
jgi:hypothetical protein